jgi:hypothetical protein
MPHFDGSGPAGQGPFTGGAQGYCALRLNDAPTNALIGFVGQKGEPFYGPSHLSGGEREAAPIFPGPARILDKGIVWKGSVTYACWRSNRSRWCWAADRAWRRLLLWIEHSRLCQRDRSSAGSESSSGRTLAATVSQMAAKPAWPTTAPMVALSLGLFEQNRYKMEEQIMPRGDRTGPRGAGAMTGRGAGFCAGYDMPGYANPVPGFGRGMGGWAAGRGGGGRGWRHWYYATGMPGWMRYGTQPSAAEAAAPSPATGSRRETLETELDWLQERLNAVRGQLDDLEEQSE